MFVFSFFFIHSLYQSKLSLHKSSYFYTFFSFFLAFNLREKDVLDFCVLLHLSGPPCGLSGHDVGEGFLDLGDLGLEIRRHGKIVQSWCWRWGRWSDGGRRRGGATRHHSRWAAKEKTVVCTVEFNTSFLCLRFPCTLCSIVTFIVFNVKLRFLYKVMPMSGFFHVHCLLLIVVPVYLHACLFFVYLQLVQCYVYVSVF